MQDRIAPSLASPSAPMQHLCDTFGRPSGILEGTSLAAHGWPLPPLVAVEDAVQLVENLLDRHDRVKVVEAYARSFALGLTPGLEIGTIYAPTIAHALGHLTQYASQRSGLDMVQVRRGGGVTSVVLSQPADLKRLGILRRETALAWIVGVLRRMHPGAPQAMAVAFRHAPIRHSQRYHDLFPCPVEFRQGADACRFPTAWEDIANPVGELDLFRFAQGRCERDFAVPPELDSYGLMRIRIAELTAANGRPPKVKELAREQACSPRTIMRRLKAAGTNFQDLVDSIQMKRASEILRTSEASVEVAAERLGYSDASSFRRSFHRWFGVNPGEWRRMSEVA